MYEGKCCESMAQIYKKHLHKSLFFVVTHDAFGNYLFCQRGNLDINIIITHCPFCGQNFKDVDDETE